MRLLLGLPYQDDCAAMQRHFMVEVARWQAVDAHILSYRSTPVCSTRNALIARMLRDDFTHLLMIDADVVPGAGFLNGVYEAMKANIDVVGYATPVLRDGSARPVWNFGWINGGEFINATAMNCDGMAPSFIDGEHMTLAEVDRIGTGAMLLSRKAAMALDEPFRFVKYANGTLKIGEDYHFCDRMRDAGFTIWADVQNKCGHYKGGVDLARFV